MINPGLKLFSLLFAGMLVFTCSTLTAQDQKKFTLSGIVSDEYGPLSGAIVTLQPENIFSPTNIDGEFSFQVYPGDYLLFVEAVNFGRISRSITVLEEDQIVNISLSKKAPTVGGRADPIDIITGEELNAAPQAKLGDALQALAPGFYANPQTISDGTDHINPISYRGLGPDQVLILINGKRMHPSSLVNVNGTFGRGAVSTDINIIPKIAVDHIEILKNGAATRYGSDAVAGVINIVLKDDFSRNKINTQLGTTTQGDGTLINVGANYGFSFGKKGVVQVSADLINKSPVNRSGNYSGTVYGDNRDDNLLPFFLQTGFKEQQVMSVGSAETKDSRATFNLNYPVGDNAEIYAFGLRNYRVGEAYGFYRFPKDKGRVVKELYPYGFAPEIHTDIIDNSITFGIRGSKRAWTLDFSNTNSSNTFDFTIEESNNASMGINSPTTAYAGGFSHAQNNTNLDVNYGIRPALSFLDSVNFAFGGVFRHERFQLFPGRPESYLQGTDTLDDGSLKAAGIQVFPGFQPTHAQLGNRDNVAGYLSLELDLTKSLLVRGAVRYETFSEVGDNVSWKASGRYVLGNFIFRAAYSTGFRAPSIHQLLFTTESTQFVDGDARLVGTFNNLHPVTRALGVDELKAELTNQLSLGFTLKPIPDANFEISSNFYNINISNRIILSGRFVAFDAQDNPTPFTSILEPLGVDEAQFFTNAVSTRTRGFDLNLSWNDIKLGNGQLNLNADANFAKNTVTAVETPSTLRGEEETLFNREERSRLEQAIPNSKIILSARYRSNRFHIYFWQTRFGQVTYIHPDDGNPENWVVNARNGSIESRDQIQAAKWTTNIEAGLRFNVDKGNSLIFSLGSINLFNAYPDPLDHSANMSLGRFQYSRRVQQFGVEGFFGYGKITFEF